MNNEKQIVASRYYIILNEAGINKFLRLKVLARFLNEAVGRVKKSSEDRGLENLLPAESIINRPFTPKLVRIFNVQ